MADELTSVAGTPAPSPETGGQAQPAATPAPQSEIAATGETSGAGVTPERSKNLFDDENFKRYQAAQSRREAELQQQLAAHQAQLREIQMSGMDDFERAQYQIQELQGALQQRDAYLEQQRAQQYRADTLRQISQEMGVPLDVIQSAESPTQAWEIAARHVRSASASEQARRAQQAEANKPYLGNGTAMATNATDNDFNSALKNRDPVAWVRAVRTRGSA